jgi:hypothetical protein
VATRSKVDLLPEAVREDLNRRLVGSAFSGYEQLADWIAEQGFAISKSALHRYGERFEERIAALKSVTEQARVIVAESPDDDNAVNDALLRLCQEKAYGLLMDMQVDPETVELPKLIRAIADMGRTSVTQKKWATQVREKSKAAADAASKIAKKGGLSADAVAEIRKQILGIGT